MEERSEFWGVDKMGLEARSWMSEIGRSVRADPGFRVVGDHVASRHLRLTRLWTTAHEERPSPPDGFSEQWRILCLLEGETQLQLGDISTALARDTVAMFPGSALYSLSAKGTSTRIEITTRGDAATPAASSPAVLTLSEHPLFAALASIANITLTTRTVLATPKGLMLERVLLNLVSGIEHELFARDRGGRRGAQRYEEIVNYIRAHASDPGLTVEALAAGLHMSTRTLLRICASRQTTPSAEISRHRAELARRLLNETELDSRNIARAAGFLRVETMQRALARHRERR